MLYLALNILFASAFTLIIKWVQVRNREDVITVGAINYIVAALWILPEFLRTDFAGDTTIAAWTGGVMGGCYFIAYFFVIYAIRDIGASSSAVVGALSILMPIGCGIFIWHERPDSWQVMGVGLAMLALTLISGRQPNGISKTPAMDGNDSPTAGANLRKSYVVLVGFFLLAGVSRLSQEAFKHESDPTHRPMFLAVAFLVAAIPSVSLLAWRREAISLRELALGVAMGASNILQTHFILRALKEYEGFVVFPVSSAGCLLLTTLIATGLLHEKLNRRKTSGIAVAVVALFLLNW